MRPPQDIDVVVELPEEGKEEALAWDDCEMDAREATRYCAVLARLQLLSIDRADIQYAANEAARRMSKQLNGDWILVKRIGKYLIGKPRVVHFSVAVAV